MPLKDCFLYSKIAPQPVKLKKGSHLESGIQVSVAVTSFEINDIVDFLKFSFHAGTREAY